MVNRDYATRVLFALSFKNLCGYQLSRYIASGDERISNGTLNPIMNTLVEKGLVSFRKMPTKKVYSLTTKGQQYVDEVRSIRNELKRRVFVDSMDENALFLDFLSNLDDATILRELLEYLGDEIMSLVKLGFILKKSGRMEELDLLKKKFRDLEEEVSQWHSQEVQN